MMIYSYKETLFSNKNWQNLGTSNMDESQKIKKQKQTKQENHYMK